MKTAIIGSKGFLGKNFMEALPEALGFHRDNASDFTQIDATNWPWSEEYDLIVHCALSSDLVEQSQIDSGIIRWWRDYQPHATLITFGTDACYTDDDHHTESYYLKGIPHKKWRYYAESKRAMYYLLLGIERPSFHFVLTSMFGPGFDLSDDHLMHSLIKKIVDGLTYGTGVSVGSPGQMKEVLYAPDVVKNVMEFVGLDPAPHARIFNLGSVKKSGLTVKEIVQKICDEVGFQLDKIKFGDTVYSLGPNTKWLDSSQAMGMIDYSDTDWSDALKPTISYYMSVQECKSL